jgi:O-succinylbenzoic acid--CoA ligase
VEAAGQGRARARGGLFGALTGRLPPWLERRAQRTPRALALITPRGSFTYEALRHLSRSLAYRLGEQGVGEGTAVAALASRWEVYAACLHAVPLLGAVLVPLNVRLTLGEMARLLDHARVRWVVADPEHGEMARELARELGLGVFVCKAQDLVEGPAPAPSPYRQVDLGAVQSVVYTSGTTGQPKGVEITWGNQWATAVLAAGTLGAVPGERYLALLPPFHVGGMAILWREVLYGGTVVALDRFDPEEANRWLEQGGVRGTSVVAAMLARMLDARGDRPYPSSLAYILLGGGPTPHPLLVRSLEAKIPVAPTYGLTESNSQVATLPPQELECHLGSAGLPLLFTEVAIAQGEELQGPGQEGEIWVRGPTVMRGYHRQPTRTARALRGGWLHTGDVGYVDEQGYLYVLDRREDLIVTGGENVVPAEVEAALLSHPAVLEAAVVGREDPVWGQRVAAAVRLRPGHAVTLAQLQAFLRPRLAGYKLPRELWVVEDFPRTASGKVQRRRVRETWPDKSLAPRASTQEG